MRQSSNYHSPEINRKPSDYRIKETPFSASWKKLDARGVEITWAWKNWLPKGFLTLLVSSVGIGKSTLALRLSASFLMEMDWLDGTPYIGEPGFVVWCESESGQFMNLSRAKKWGLPLEHIISPLGDALDDFNLSDRNHRDALEKLARNREVRFVVIDSLRGAIQGDENNSELIEDLKYLAELAQKNQLPILLIHHLRKKGINDYGGIIDIDRIRGTSAIAQIPRVVIAINTPDPNAPDKRQLSVIKSNLGLSPNPIGISITDHGIDVIPDPAKTRRFDKINQSSRAEKFLKDILKDGPKSSTEIFEEGEKQGICKPTLKRLKKNMGILARREGKGWVWQFFEDN